MSIRIMTAVWDTQLPDSEKIVLLALADCANDEGLCWPSMATLTAKCSKSDRTIQAAIKSLAAAGHLTREERPGKGCRYTIHPRKDFSPEKASPPKPLRPEGTSPPKGTTPTPEAASDKPSRTITSPPVRAKALPTPAGGSGPAGDDLGEGEKPKAAKPRKRAVGSRLSENWQAPAVADLPLEVQAVVGLWPAGAYELTAIMFRNHWLAEGRAIGAKRDWARTWHNWLLRENMTILRAVKAGQRFDATAPAVATRPAPAESAAAADVLAQKVGETEQVRQIRRLVRLRMGPAPYDSWLKVSAIEIRRGEVRVTSPTTFQASWVEQHFALPLREAAQEVLGEELRVRVGVARPGESKAA